MASRFAARIRWLLIQADGIAASSPAATLLQSSTSRESPLCLGQFLIAYFTSAPPLEQVYDGRFGLKPFGPY
jgi:hypothetical protein